MRRLHWFVLLCLTSGCSLFSSPDHFEARPTAFNMLSGWQEESHDKALAVFLNSCPVLAVKARATSSGSNLTVPEGVWRKLCNEGVKSSGNKARAKDFFEQNFTPFIISNNRKEQGLFTGYYEPLLYGAKHPGGDFRYPLYAPPSDKPNVSRADITSGVLDNQGLELVWVDDPVMAFFLHIQGSGRVKLTNGKELRVGYAGKNDQPYIALGKIMGDEGLIPKDSINFFSIRQWLYEHPDQAIEIMNRNPSYVFFKILDTPAPVGAIGVPLTPQRSLAVDSRYIPYGLPLYLQTELPLNGNNAKPVTFARLMIAQDTGGAIRGPVRGDIFFGTGDDAEYLAGTMKGRGTYSLLVPNDIAYLLKE